MAAILIASLSGLVSEKAGIVNIGINGMMIAGAFMFKVGGFMLHGEQLGKEWTFTISLLIGGLGAMVFAAIHGFACITLKSDHVISGTAINLLASAMALFLIPKVAEKYRPGTPNNVLGQIYSPNNIGTTNFGDYTIYYISIAVFIAITLIIYFKHTKIGKHHAAIGENPNAADSASINVNMLKYGAVLLSGFLAGVAGGMANLNNGSFSGNVQGLGFVALAIMILGQWRISLIFLCSFGFAMIWGYATSPSGRLFGMSNSMMKMLPFILSLVSLIALSKFQAAPKAVGLHFDKSKR